MTPSYCLLTNLPIACILVNLLLNNVICLINSFDQYTMITFLLTHYLVPGVISNNYIHMIICFSCSYNIGHKLFYIPMATMVFICVVLYKFDITALFYRAGNMEHHHTLQLLRPNKIKFLTTHLIETLEYFQGYTGIPSLKVTKNLLIFVNPGKPLCFQNLS